MSVSRHRFQLVTDTGANASGVSSPMNGSLMQIAYRVADTGVRADTGAVITVTLDTGGGGSGVNLLVTHLKPNDASWAFHFQPGRLDTGGAQPFQSRLAWQVASEKVKVSVQGLATDTGKEVDLALYVSD